MRGMLDRCVVQDVHLGSKIRIDLHRIHDWHLSRLLTVTMAGMIMKSNLIVVLLPSACISSSESAASDNGLSATSG